MLVVITTNGFVADEVAWQNVTLRSLLLTLAGAWSRRTVPFFVTHCGPGGGGGCSPPAAALPTSTPALSTADRARVTSVFTSALPSGASCPSCWVVLEPCATRRPDQSTSARPRFFRAHDRLWVTRGRSPAAARVKIPAAMRRPATSTGLRGAPWRAALVGALLLILTWARLPGAPSTGFDVSWSAALHMGANGDL